MAHPAGSRGMSRIDQIVEDVESDQFVDKGFPAVFNVFKFAMSGIKTPDFTIRGSGSC
jgi:hypothetical protein